MQKLSFFFKKKANKKVLYAKAAREGCAMTYSKDSYRKNDLNLI